MKQPKRIKTRREEYADQTREALLEAARVVFTSEGYQLAGIEGIAQAARVTRGAFYHHFEDKRALFEALVTTLQQGAADQIRQRAQDARPEERVMAGAAAFLDACTDPAYRRLVIQDAPAVLGEERCREIGEAHAYGLLIAALADLKKAGRFDCDNTYLAARMLGSMICEAALLLGPSKSPKVLKRQALAIVEGVFAAFGRPVSG